MTGINGETLPSVGVSFYLGTSAFADAPQPIPFQGPTEPCRGFKPSKIRDVVSRPKIRASNAEIWNFTLILRRYDYGRIVTNIPRDASICFNSQIALSSVVELLAWSICRRSAFKAGSLSLIVHRHANTCAS